MIQSKPQPTLEITEALTALVYALRCTKANPYSIMRPSGRANIRELISEVGVDELSESEIYASGSAVVILKKWANLIGYVDTLDLDDLGEGKDALDKIDGLKSYTGVEIQGLMAWRPPQEDIALG